ncbi:MAG: enoyl-CoA hydratase/isomerase family protein [candidate division Zixibacteria bacterium]|nr:enoyl-CoA hydratase/isomerase family protein [candidate division Zixibacteria bacterium]
MNKTSSETLLLSRDGAVVTLTLNRPAKRNSLDQELIGALTGAFESLGVDSETRVIVLRGAGSHFCSGLYLDYLQEISGYGMNENITDSNRFATMLKAIHHCQKPVIAKVQGYALAGGCGIATACDIIIADTSAKFGYTETRFGFVPAIVASFLMRRVGESVARDLLLTARVIDANEALALGLVNHVVAPDELDRKVNEFADMLSKNSASSLELTKDLIDIISAMPLEGALDYAVRVNALARQTDDFKSGLKGILKKLKS